MAGCASRSTSDAHKQLAFFRIDIKELTKKNVVRINVKCKNNLVDNWATYFEHLTKEKKHKKN